MNDMVIHPGRATNLISLCAGGAGLDLGVGLAIPSARAICLVEREGYAIGQLVSAMQEGLLAPAPIWSDARTFDGRPWRGLVDGIIGGIPCQPHSQAGKKKGSNDERDLWSPARRTIVQSRPWFVLIENVAGMLTAGDDEVAGAKRVWRDLRKLGFSVEGGLFTASEVGASHQRERFFILGVADVTGWGMADAGGAGLQGSEFGGTSGERYRPEAPRSAAELRGAHVGDSDHQQGRGQHEFGIGEGAELGDASSQFRSDVADGAAAGRQQVSTLDRAAGGDRDGRGSRRDLSGERRDEETIRFRPLFAPGPCESEAWRSVLEAAPEFEPSFRRVADGLAARMDIGRLDRLRMLGNGVVPLQAAYALRTLAARLASRGSAGATELLGLMRLAA